MKGERIKNREMKKPLVEVITFVFLFVLSFPASALDITYDSTGVSQLRVDAFEQAAQRWESLLNDPVSVNIKLSFSSMGTGIIGGTWPSLWYAGFLKQESFSGVRDRLVSDQTSLADAAAVDYLNSLPVSGLNLSWYSNNHLGGPDSLHESDSTIVGTSANLKALGYTGFTGDDAEMEFNSDFSFDYNPSNGIDSGKVDFVGVATHEIGHALGFVSMVDYNAHEGAVIYPPSILDLYRHTDEYGPGQIDISFDGRDAYFSYDGGLTTVDLSDGKNSLGVRQASHWADGSGLGIMDPTAAHGELLTMTGNDLLALDVIGWNVIPEPGTIFLLSTGLLALAVRCRRVSKNR